MSAQREQRVKAGPQAEGAPVIVCPRCRGRNAATAAWCSQCLTGFEHSSGPAEERVAGRPATAPTPAPAAPIDSARADDGVRATDDGVVWRCARCGADNPLTIGAASQTRQATMACSVCDATFADLVRGPPPARPARDPGKTALISLFMPGAGHAYLGLWGQGIARAVLSVWVVSAFFAGAVGGQGAQRLLVAGFFALASAALWAVTAHDAYREAKGEPGAVILGGRSFLWVVLGLLMALMVALVLPAIGAARA